MDNPIIGEIYLFGFTFAPRHTKFCNGQLLAISQFQSLFSLLGNNFGGDGRTTFGLPDMRGRTPVGHGQGPGMSINWDYGAMHGSEFQQLTVNEMPSHTHGATFTPTGGGPVSVDVKASTDKGETATPADGSYLADVEAPGGPQDHPEHIYRGDAGSGTVSLGGVEASGGSITGGTVQVQQTGGSQQFPIIQPGLGLNYCISTDGLYPSRS